MIRPSLKEIWYEYKGGGLRVTNITGENEREQCLGML